MSNPPRRAAERLSPTLQPVTDKPARLSLSDASAPTEDRYGHSVRIRHAASSLSPTTESIAGGRKPSTKSAAVDAALAARTTARLSSRSTSSNQQQEIM